MIEKYDDMQPIEFVSCPHVESRYSEHFSVRMSGTRVRLKFFVNVFRSMLRGLDMRAAAI